MKDVKYKVIKIGDQSFAIIKIMGGQSYTLSKYKDKKQAQMALIKLQKDVSVKEAVDINRAMNVTNARFSPIEETDGKKDTLERNVRQLHRLGSKKDSDKRKQKRYSRILKRIRSQMENKRVDSDSWKPQYTGKKLTDAEREAAKSHYKATQDPEKGAKLADDKANYEKKKREELEAKRKAAGGLAHLIKKKES